MTTFASFTSTDWNQLVEALLTSGDLVIAASPQGTLGTLKEKAVYYAEISQVLQNGTAYGLVDELRVRTQARLDELQRGQPEPPLPFDQARRAVLERCRLANQILLGRAEPAEIEYYKQGLLWACRQAARAAREGGGFLGIGAVEITSEENEAIRQIAFALGLPASAALVETPPEAPYRPGPPGVAKLFTADEWNTLCLAPFWISLAMSAATPDGTIGSAQELVAMGRGLQEAVMRQPPNSLVALLLKDLTRNRNTLQSDKPVPFPLVENPMPGQAIADGLDYCRQAAALVEQKASPQDALEYKRLLVDLARQVAQAAKTGGAAISPAEQNLLDELSSVLGV